MSRVVRLIQERHSMRASPSFLRISALQMSRSYKCFTIMAHKHSMRWNIDLNCLVYEDFGELPYLLRSECRILSNRQQFNIKATEHDWLKSCATGSIGNSSRTDLGTKCVPDAYGHLLLQVEVLCRIVRSSKKSIPQFIRGTYVPFPKTPRRVWVTNEDFWYSVRMPRAPYYGHNPRTIIIRGGQQILWSITTTTGLLLRVKVWTFCI